MITIQRDGRTFKLSGVNINDIHVYKTITEFIELGYLEEVKDNKQALTLPEMKYKGEREYYMDGQKCTPEQALEAMKLNMRANYEERNSILEKLREELERRINSEEWSTPYMEVKWELEEVLDFVNSLETKENKEPTWVDDLQGISKLIEEDVKKEQFTPGQTNYCDSRTDDERARDEELYRTATVTSTSNVWTPTPGQEIEVSNDGEKWEKRILKRMSFVGGLKLIETEDNYWQFARPIEDKIELLPPHEFSYDSQTEFEMIVMQRLELLTNALNQLIAKQN